MLDKLGKIVVMGLAARTDRWERCLEIFKHFNISDFHHYEMVRHGSGWMQYALDTKKMLSETADQQEQNEFNTYLKPAYKEYRMIYKEMKLAIDKQDKGKIKSLNTRLRRTLNKYGYK